MARSSKLKVYRTPIGFHDAYVAAPSQKAALEAWRSDKNLFARGDAELVKDVALTAEPLAAPGTVIKRLRGTTAEQIAALPADRPKPRKASTVEQERASASAARARSASRARAKPPSKPKPPPKPKPSREALDRAEQALSAAEREHEERLREIVEREAALARERLALEKSGEEEAGKLRRAREDAAAAYEAAMTHWRG